MDEIEIISFFDYREAKCKVIFNHEKVGYVEINPDRIVHKIASLDWKKAIELRDFLNQCIDRMIKDDCQDKQQAL